MSPWALYIIWNFLCGTIRDFSSKVSLYRTIQFPHIFRCMELEPRLELNISYKIFVCHSKISRFAQKQGLACTFLSIISIQSPIYGYFVQYLFLILNILRAYFSFRSLTDHFHFLFVYVPFILLSRKTEQKQYGCCVLYSAWGNVTYLICIFYSTVSSKLLCSLYTVYSPNGIYGNYGFFM